MLRGQDPSWIWSRYWLRDQHDECLTDALGLAGLWRDYLSAFADGARLLDLATGSGEAAELAASAARELDRTFAIDAIDSASLPAGLIKRMRKRGVRLIGDVDAAALPFEDGGYDGVFSQFGIEYAARPQAFLEAARMLRAGGRGLFVMHHRESVITRTCAMRLVAHRTVIGPTDCFASAKKLFTSYLLGGSPAFLQQAEANFRNEVAMLRVRLGEPPTDQNLVPAVRFLTEIAVMPSRYDPADALKRLKFAQEDVQSWRLRQEAQQAASLDTADLESVGACLAQEGLNVAPPEIVRDANGEIAAWALRFHRPASA